MASQRALVATRASPIRAARTAQSLFQSGRFNDVLVAGPESVFSLIGNWSTLGNDASIRARQSLSLRSLPSFEGLFDLSAIIALEEDHTQDESSLADDILHASLLTRPGCHVDLLTCSTTHVPSSSTPLHTTQRSDYAPALQPADEHERVHPMYVSDGYQASWLPISVSGEIEAGAGKGSASLGFPTANVRCDPGACIPRGVYVCWAHLNGKFEPEGAVANIGERPSVDDSRNVTTEVHLFSDHGSSDLRGMVLGVTLCGWIRPEIRFEGLEHLSERIAADVHLAKVALSSSEYLKQLKPQER